MMLVFLSGMVGTLVFFGLVLGCIAWARKRWRIHPEVCRKTAHVVMGVACLAFPVFVTSVWQILLLAAAFIAGLTWMRLSSSPMLVGVDVFRASRRHSMGEYYFVAGVASAFVLAGGDRFAYASAVLLLAFADAAACAVGILVGRFRCWGNTKTLEGSLAFAAVAVICLAALGFSTGFHPGWALCATLCLVATIAEAFAPRDADNLMIPLASVVCLRVQDWLPLQVITGFGLVVAVVVGLFGLLAVRMIRRSPAFWCQRVKGHGSALSVTGRGEAAGHVSAAGGGPRPSCR